MKDVASVAEYLDTLELPQVFESVNADAEAALGPTFVNGPQAVAVGAQLAEFTDKVPPDLRAAISDGLLLGQLAANKAAEKPGASPEVFAWYDKYIEVLKGIGWRVVDFEQQTQEVKSLHAGVHTAIIPVVTAMLGPAVAAASMVISILKGLKEMDPTNKWMTLFDRASRHAHGAKFQVGYVDVPEGADPTIKVVCFTIDARREVTQVLFFKFTADGAELRKAVGSFSVGRERLLSSSTLINERVQPFIADFVRDIEI